MPRREDVRLPIEALPLFSFRLLTRLLAPVLRRHAALVLAGGLCRLPPATAGERLRPTQKVPHRGRVANETCTPSCRVSPSPNWTGENVGVTWTRTEKGAGGAW